MSEQAEEGSYHNGEAEETENDQTKNEDQAEEEQAVNPNVLQSVQEAASNLLGDGDEKAKKKRRIKKRVRVKKTNENAGEEEEGEKQADGEEEENNEYTYEYQYDYEYYSDDEENKKNKKKNKRYPDRPDHLDLSEPICHLDVPYDPSTSGPESPRSPRKKKVTKQPSTASRNENQSLSSTTPRNENQSLSSTTPRKNSNSPRSPKSPNNNNGNKSPRPKKTNLSQTTNPRSTRNDEESLPPLNNTTQPHASSEEVEQYVKKALNKEPILDLTDEVYGDILFDLAEKRKKYAIHHNYKEGDRMSEAITFVEKCQKKTQMNAYAVDYKKNFDDEKSRFENDFKNYDTETQELFNELKEKQQQKREALLAEQRRERDEHRQKWTSDWMVRQYNKQSVQLTQMRKQHSLLLCQNRFKEAESLNNLIVQKAKQEEDVSMKSYQFDYDSSVKMLKERQKLEIENFESQCENQFIKLKGDRARRRVAFEFREKKINSKGSVANDPEKIWNASMLQRVENNAANSQKRAGLPSTRMKKEDLKDLDIMTLSLPRLKVDQEKDDKQKDKTKTKPKPQEDENVDEEL